MRTGTSFQAIRTRARFSSGAYAVKTLAHIGQAAECLAALSNRAEPRSSVAVTNTSNHMNESELRKR